MLFDDSGSGRATRERRDRERRERERPPLGKLWDLASSKAIRIRPGPGNGNGNGNGNGGAGAPTLLVVDRELEHEQATAQAVADPAPTPQVLEVPHDTAGMPVELASRSSKARERLPQLRFGLVLADVCAALSGAAMAEVLLGLSGLSGAAFAAATVGGWCALALALGLYSGNDTQTWSSGVFHAPRLLVAALLISWPLFAVASAVGLTQPSAAALVASLTAVLASGFLRALVRFALHRRGQLRQRTLIIGSGTIAGELVHKLRTQTHFGLDPIGFVDDDPHLPAGTKVPYCGSLDDL